MGGEQDAVGFALKFLLISMISHAIPNPHDEDGIRGSKTPNQKLPSQVSYRHPLSSNQEIRRASEQTSPQVARAVGPPRSAGRGRRIGQWQQLRSAVFPFQGLENSNQVGEGEVEAMGLSFRGEFNQKVDGKGRMSIPADFRRVLELGDPAYSKDKLPRMVVLYGPHLKNCLHAYTIEAMAEIEAGIQNLPRGSDARKKASRLILGKSWETEVDRDGRIVLPKERREQIGLAEEAVMVAMGDYFEIWNADTFRAEEAAEIDSFLSDMPDDFDPLSLISGGG